MKAWLSRAGVLFTVRDVDEDDQAYEDLIALGFRSIPITVIGEQRIRGFNPAAMTAALTVAGRG